MEYKEKVEQKIKENNGWYTASQFKWAQKPEIKRIYENRRKIILNSLNKARKLSKGKINVLDLGCGDGYWLQFLSQQGDINLTGVDYNHLRIERAKEICPNIEILCDDINNSTIDKKFDFILFNHVLEHIEDDLQILNSIKRIMHENTILLIGVPNEGSPFHQKTLRESGAIKTTDHVHFYTEKSLKNKLKKTGYKILRISRECLYLPYEKLFYKFTKSWIGFKFLSFLTLIFPQECSGFYFELKTKEI